MCYNAPTDDRRPTTDRPTDRRRTERRTTNDERRTTERPNDRTTERRHSSVLLVIFSLLLAIALPSCADVKGLFTKDRDGVGVCIGYGDETALPDTGMGTEAEPYVLCLPAHLSLIGSGDYELSAYYIQGRTLNLNNELFTPIGGTFTGTLDGNGYKIQNLTISVSTKRAGLFAELGTDGLIQNLALEGGNVESTNTGGSLGDPVLIGALVAYMNGGDIRDSYSTASLNGGAGNYDFVGGLVGEQSGGSIIASYATGEVDGGEGNNDRAGGLVGRQDGGEHHRKLRHWQRKWGRGG